MKKSEKGQALLIVVLVMVVALTVGLSIASKTITSLRTSTEEANSQKALAAAEAGIEQAIKNNVPIAETKISSDNTTYKTDVAAVSGTSFLMNGGNPVLQDNGSDLWLSDYSSDPNNLYKNSWPGRVLTIKWGTSADPCQNAALEVVIISGSKASPTTKRYTFDPCAQRAGSNRFSLVGLTQGSVSGKSFFYEAVISDVLSPLLGRVIPLYFNSPVGIIGDVALPSQGSTITSTGTSGTTSRKVNVFQGYPEIPSEFFPYNLFSPL